MVITVLIICEEQSFCPSSSSQKEFDQIVAQLTAKIQSLGESLKSTIQKINDANVANQKTNQENTEKVAALKNQIASLTQGDKLEIEEPQQNFNEEQEKFVTPPGSPRGTGSPSRRNTQIPPPSPRSFDQGVSENLGSRQNTARSTRSSSLKE